jgi:pimeloyl-ACP methyl ester carboxylesterase
MGGYVALLLKEELNACEKVVLLNSNFWADNEQKKKDRIRMADIAFKSKRVLINEAIPNLFGEPNKFPLEIEQLKSEALQMSSESIAYASLAMRERKDFSKPIQNNPTDFFIIHGKQDRLVQTQEIKDKTPNSTNLMIIENAGHMAHIESPEMVMSHLRKIFC